jgi:hypothetical protein
MIPIQKGISPSTIIRLQKLTGELLNWYKFQIFYRKKRGIFCEQRD